MTLKATKGLPAPLVAKLEAQAAPIVAKLTQEAKAKLKRDLAESLAPLVTGKQLGLEHALYLVNQTKGQ